MRMRQGRGTVVWKLGPRGEQAALEIQELFTELVAYELTTENNERSISANG